MIANSSPSLPLPLGTHPIGVLADYLANDPSTLTTFVDRLEQRQYVERQNDPDDRRVKLIALTESGERAVEDLQGLSWLKSRRSPSSPWLNCVSSARCSRTSIRRCQGTRPRPSILPGDAAVTDYRGFPDGEELQQSDYPRESETRPGT